MRSSRLAYVVLVVALVAACGGSDSPTSPSPAPAPAPAPAPPPPPPRPLWTLSGSGNSVFDVPADVTRLQIRGQWNNTGTSNFIVRIGGSLVVNEILREKPNGVYEGTHLVRGGVGEITNSSNVAWSMTEVR